MEVIEITVYKYNESDKKSLPPSGMYGIFLDMAIQKFKIPIQKARKKYGDYTIEQWEMLLKTE